MSNSAAVAAVTKNHVYNLEIWISSECWLGLQNHVPEHIEQRCLKTRSLFYTLGVLAKEVSVGFTHGFPKVFHGFPRVFKTKSYILITSYNQYCL